MPITQSRMIAVIDAGMALDNSMHFMMEMIETELANLQQGRASQEEATMNIMMHMKAAAPDAKLLAKLYTEYQHFRRNKHANERAKEKQQRRAARRRGESPSPSTLRGGTPRKYQGLSLEGVTQAEIEAFNNWPGPAELLGESEPPPNITPASSDLISRRVVHSDIPGGPPAALASEDAEDGAII